MSSLDDAKYMLDKSQDDLRFRHDLQIEALITVLIALVETQQAILKTIKDLSLPQGEPFVKVKL